ncbi:Sodium:dicarboxylate symporter [Planococcus antarcticus DSM 14505]|uniref:Dicarboxylate/amino acid:cation symporter n=1 Tax=Planococcus antarcticus DSM 14505 TaxID=1185653 RepID=A0A1C7DEJ1_9BACL|nr:dicarboxylate/amino acid:cation symporter [Planococcus antarcticus]ANU09874.1 dicarboxylate/amino acid:cation symporter [Planococcus antarcticus DSM 14505]EIM07516.1 Sodium:dicarboxylate symporter [Planococcus antarcticus DSM 14505]
MKKPGLTVKVLTGLILGAIVGLLINLFVPDSFEALNTYLFVPLGQIFLSLINMLVVPLVLFSIILGTAGLGDPAKLGRIGIKTVTYFLVTTTIAITIGLSLAAVIQPGLAGDFDLAGAEFESEKAPSVGETLLNMIPTNPIAALGEGNMLQIIVFAVFIGLALTALGEKTKGLVHLVEQGNDVMMYLVGIVMKFAPYGTFGLIATAVGSQGFSAMKAMGSYMLVIVAALLIHAIFTYGGTIKFLAKKSPIWFFKKFAPAMSVGFSTSSSTATLPISMEVAQNELGVPKSVSSFVQPLGATINMDGTAIMQGVATMFIAQAYGVELSTMDLVTVVLTAVLASIGTAGVPGVGLIMLAMVLGSVGLPPAGIGLVIGIDRLLDMTRTAVNISGDAACAVYVAETEKNRDLRMKNMNA